MLKTPRNFKKVKCVIGEGAPKIKGKTYKIREVWYSVQHPAGPPLVVVETQEGQK